MKSPIAEDLGRIFEVGFNIGILAYIDQHKIKNNFGNQYREDLQQLKLPKMLKRVSDKVISSLERQMAEKWINFFLLKGFFGGLNFFREYLQATGWSESPKLRHLEILYYQCCFSDDNSLGIYPKGDEQWSRDILSQFPNIDTRNYYLKPYLEKGEFLRADTLILLRFRGRQLRILSVDLSVFSVKTSSDIQNLDYVEILRSWLMRDIRYFKSKSVFSNLRLDTGALGLDFSEDLKSYFTAFKYGDKESTKLIQAASYAYSFQKFLQKEKLLEEKTSVIINAVGYSDRGMSTMSVSSENNNLDILESCHQIYKHDSSPKDISDARKLVLQQIQRNAYRSFEKGKDFIDDLLAIPTDKTTLVTHQERIANFVNSVGEVPQELINQLGLNGTLNLREAHAELIKKALVSDATYIFLTGNPGIGKTTAIASFLKAHLEEGFLFFYVSPRKQVNLDIIDKFKDPATGKLCDNRLLAINTNSDLIKDNFGQYTVQYLWNEHQDDFKKKSVTFLDSRKIERKGRRSNRLNRLTENLIKDVGQKTKGVLNSICEAIYTLVDGKTSNNIIATVSIQALKKTDTGDTLKHFEKIFKNAYNEREAMVLPNQMKDISKRIKNLFIMIDEITGDDGGVEFLSGISNILSKYQLTDSPYGFNVKIIVADASIVDQEVITQHLSSSSAEPDKIYFRHASNLAQPLAVQQFSFKGLPATAINTNSYPASNLDITYKVVVDSYKFSDKSDLQPSHSSDKNLLGEMLRDIEFLSGKSGVEQIIVYIQNKRKLSELIDKIRKRRGGFQQSKDYLEIHANISEEEKKQIQDYKNDVKIIFMTASGSRGLSFPKAKHILVEIPRFEIEQNLMEVIQVIYRGRGQYRQDGVEKTLDSEDKDLLFYLADQAVYYDEQDEEKRELSIQESVLSLLNILLILKASIMTRIQGYGQIGRQKFMMIPIGGKSISAVGETFSAQMASLIRELKKEHNRKKDDIRLQKVYTNLEKLLSKAEFVLRNKTESEGIPSISYLDLKESFNCQFSQLVNNGLDGLLRFGNIETGYISGGLLIVPTVDKSLEETYEMRLSDILTNASPELGKNMWTISRSLCYPENLRSAIKDAIELVKKLQEPVKTTQRFEQKSQRFDQYYAIPLFIFITGDVLSKYFTGEEEEPEDRKFCDLLATYVRTLYPVGNILPIGHQYKDFPFVVFRSYSLDKIRNKMFTDKYLLNSNELNVLNMILTKQS